MLCGLACPFALPRSHYSHPRAYGGGCELPAVLQCLALGTFEQPEVSFLSRTISAVLESDSDPDDSDADAEDGEIARGRLRPFFDR